jgi:hypothetical protein
LKLGSTRGVDGFSAHLLNSEKSMTQMSVVDIVITVFVFCGICALGLGILMWLIAKPYPKEWEEAEERELERKFKEYDEKQKSQD